MSNKNVTGTLLIVAATEKEEVGLKINYKYLPLMFPLGAGRPPSPRETSFPDVRVSSLVVCNP